jgi:hypothetical protein
MLLWSVDRPILQFDRAAYRVGAPLWRETRHDDLAEHLADDLSDADPGSPLADPGSMAEPPTG